MDAWLARMRQNGGIIPSFVDLDGRIGGAEGRWWGNAYGWGFSPVNPVTGQTRGSQPHSAGDRRLQQRAARHGRSEVRRRVARDDRRGQRHTRASTDGRKEYPTMRGADGWYGWRPEPWNVGALEVWYWSMRDEDRAAHRATILAGVPGRARTTAIPRRRCSAIWRASRGGWRRCARIGRRRRSGSPTTCSTSTPRRSTRWCA